MADTLDLGSWCILRMASRDTLPVAKALEQMGYMVWTPCEERVRRMPRTRKKFVERLAIMPSYVFAPAGRLEDLLSLSVVPTFNCPSFTVFKYGDGFPLISDSELDALRSEESHRRERFERQRAKKRKAPTFERGLVVPLMEPGFEGLSGKVVETQGGYTLIEIPGFPQPIKISSLLLEKGVLASEVIDSGAKAA